MDGQVDPAQQPLPPEQQNAAIGQPQLVPPITELRVSRRPYRLLKGIQNDLLIG